MSVCKMRLSCQVDGHDLQAQPLPPRRKGSRIRIWTYQGAVALLRYIRLYVIFGLYDLSSALSLGKGRTRSNANGSKHHKRVLSLQAPTRILAKVPLAKSFYCDSNYRKSRSVGQPPARRRAQARAPKLLAYIPLKLSRQRGTRIRIPGPEKALLQRTCLTRRAACRASSSGATASAAVSRFACHSFSCPQDNR